MTPVGPFWTPVFFLHVFLRVGGPAGEPGGGVPVTLLQVFSGIHESGTLGLEVEAVL